MLLLLMLVLLLLLLLPLAAPVYGFGDRNDGARDGTGFRGHVVCFARAAPETAAGDAAQPRWRALSLWTLWPARLLTGVLHPQSTACSGICPPHASSSRAVCAPGETKGSRGERDESERPTASGGRVSIEPAYRAVTSHVVQVEIVLGGSVTECAERERARRFELGSPTLRAVGDARSLAAGQT
jgi:hypothetical protein